jgi:hypothetical protein
MGNDAVPRESVDCRSWFFTFIGVAGPALVIAGFVVGQNYLIGIGVAAYLVHLCVTGCLNKASRYLSNVMNEKQFHDYIVAAQQAPPCLKWTIQCYHYETRTRTVTDQDGKSRTETYKERVNTHYAETCYDVKGFLDETLSAQQTLAMFHLLHDGTLDDVDVEKGTYKGSKSKRTLVLLCHFPIEFHPASQECHDDYYQKLETFYAENNRDTHCDKRELRYLPSISYIERAMIVLNGDDVENASRPFWMNYPFYFLCCLFLMSVPYQLLLYSRTQKCEWLFLKHFSNRPCHEWSEPPMRSRSKRNDKASQAFKAIPRENAPVSAHAVAVIVQDLDQNPSVISSQIPLEVPSYWKNKDLSLDFDDKINLPTSELSWVQSLLDSTFKEKATRDREGKLPTRLIVERVLRMEDKRMWLRYAQKRSLLAGSPYKSLESLPGSGSVKTSCAQRSDLFPHINEAYLFHGSSPSAAMGIGEDGFKMSYVGSHVGTMFGRGAYFAEASSKSDEYASEDPSGVFSGRFAFLLCRVALGNPLYITESDVPAIEAALSTGMYNSVLGDREAAVDTYREFVALEESQIYPEFIVIYKRSF